MAMTALVTGVSKGIGKALSELLVSRGWEVYGVSRSDPQLTLDGFNWIEFDLMEFDQYSELASMLPDSLDLLVNNAGISYVIAADKILNLDLEKQIGINMRAPILLMTMLAGRLEGAKVVNISSVFSKVPHKGLALYSASKAALNEFSRGYTLDTGIETYTLMPSMVDTPIAHTIYGEDHDYSQLLQPEDVAAAAFSITEGEYASGDQIVLAREGEQVNLSEFEANIKVTTI